MRSRGVALREFREMFAPYCFLKKDTIPMQKLETGDYGYSNISKYSITNRNIVIKQIYYADSDQEKLNKLFSQYILLMRATNRYLNPPIGFIFNNPIIIASNYIPNGNLYEAIKSGRLNPTDKTKIAMGIAYALRRLHKMHIVHGDLKSRNIMLGDDMRPLVSDFGYGAIALALQVPIQYRINDPYWCAPEVLTGAVPTSASDVYSFGTLISELYNEQVPAQGAAVLARTHQEFIPSSAPKILRALVQCCTMENPARRPDFRRIYRLFKNGNCYFPGTDLTSVKKEVIAIKADIHKSHNRFTPLIPSPLPSREQIQDLINKNSQKNQQRRAQRLVTSKSASIGVKEARALPIQGTLINNATEGKFAALNGKMSLSLNAKLNMQIKDSTISKLSSPKAEDNNPMSLANKTVNISLPNHGNKLLSDGSKYLRLPHKSRYPRVPNSMNEICVVDRIFKTISGIKIERYKGYDAKAKITRSLLTITALLKQGNISIPCFQKEDSPSGFSLSKQVMPFLRQRRRLTK
ncbi:TKL family protein kinase [Trichomonas vaginalis G3]|uniref:TKL family protein kinase n=1 Tax=Trichomonas vaginalis (strain ATCC PRA-98 / G3) TaxID=412133 RepID=A2GG33_TRIV3|nr:protein kinase protein [Trichomonas vaginalis G3]EAX83883.1 TKL family protein kinase [Trichomonas vaginalis G3]KAI5493130.1 protein kinase protein [Trichomonas vaginalis G3]|eukprot:XP_001296813.1 TKL family protein kinase [Trichomonas vaginalis G3]